MSQGQFVTGWFTPLQGSLPPLPDRPGWKPEHPWEPGGPYPGQPLPPLPPGVGGGPIHPPEVLPPEVPGVPGHPIEIPEEPGQPLPLPPGFVWPPFDPSDALSGKVLLLCWVPGVQKLKWVVIDVPEITLPTPPPGGWGSGKPGQLPEIPPGRQPK